MLKVLMKFRENDIELVKKEMREFEDEQRKTEVQSKLTWREFFKKREISRALFVTAGIQIMQQFSGKTSFIKD